MELKRVVVTGLGAITPLGNNVNDTWNSLVNGVSGSSGITLFDATKFKTCFACEVKNFDPYNHFDRKEMKRLDRYAQFAILSAKEAIIDSMLDNKLINCDRVGVIFSSGIGGISTFEQEVANYYLYNDKNVVPRINPFFIPKMISDIAAGHISMIYGFRGPNFGTVSACATSTTGLIVAFDTIRLGKADVIISGGAEASITPTGVGGFNAMNALSTRNESPETASRPFSASRDGFVIGEGGVCIVLEEMEHALVRGAKIYAEIVGGGASGDAYHLTASHPDGLGAVLVMKNALVDANLIPEDIDYINVHGTSTPVGDISEVIAIKKVFGNEAYKLDISSTKSMTGHMLGATGAIEAMVCVLVIKNSIIPPTINHALDDNDNKIDYKLNFTFNKAKKRNVVTALSNTFGFGGHNACIIVKKFFNENI
ncbi:MAG: beta-ketoacyl-ACP synthase II [Bacteroidales bacterium OttesenSCG-928-I14]|jgi:3-oxoacyl-[acyl-carrier-protein] synthase II|nr:beta-ketoacyl-ACP synthase II [Bacteroidales bacterium OttesenSCG-928-I14]